MGLDRSVPFRYKLIRGKLDLNAVVGRMQARSRYGGKSIGPVSGILFSAKLIPLQPRSRRSSKLHIFIHEVLFTCPHDYVVRKTLKTALRR